MPAGDGVEGPDVGMRGDLPSKTQTLFANLDEKRKLICELWTFLDYAGSEAGQIR